MTGRLKIQLFGATNIPSRRSANDQFYAVIKVDGSIKGQTKPTNENFNADYFDIQVDRSNEVEILVYDQQSKALMSVVWFSLQHLFDDLTARYPDKYPDQIKTITDVGEMWLDMEPGGQILLKTIFGTSLNN